MAHEISFDAILRATAICARVRLDDLTGPSRRKADARPRQLAVLITRRVRPELSLPFIGRRLGGRDHTTVLHSERRALERVEANDPFEVELLAAVLSHLGLDRLPEPQPTSYAARQRINVERDLVIARARVAALEAQLANLPECA